MKSPLISIIMPVYNAEKYIGRAIESVLNQTYKNIELIICNDCSSDNTVEIIGSYSDPRVTLINNTFLSGSAYIPREMAFFKSRGEYVVLLDSDDYIEEDYVERIYERLINCEADLCSGRMVYVNEEGNELGHDFSVPNYDFDFSLIMSGRKAFFYTVPDWKIGMNGCMTKREIWDKALKKNYKPGKHGIHDDENVSRFLLLYSKLVVFCDVNYYYTINSDSVTHVFNKRIFDLMNSENELLKLIEDDYGKDSAEYKAVECSDFNAYKQAIYHFIDSFSLLKKSELNGYIKVFEMWHDRLVWKEIMKYSGLKSVIFHRCYFISFVFLILRRKNFNFFLFLFIKKIKTISSIFRKYQKWFFIRKQREKLILKKIINQYKYFDSDCSDDLFNNSVINVIDGSINSGGLADRLRGIISTFAICKKNCLPYKLYFTSPFRLEEFLKPAKYDWMIHEETVRNNSHCCDIVVLDTTEDGLYHFNKQKKYLEDRISNINGKPKYVYTNAGFSYCLDYSSLFHELFKPSERLKNSIDAQKNILGNDYISVSARFLDLLGDFNETFGNGTLSRGDAQKLIEDSLKQLEKIHNNYPKNKILVTSDSNSFLKAVSKYNYTYTIPGTITHIDNDQNDDSYQRYEKTFLDFFMIANAKKIFLLKGKLMHRSGYPYAASKIYNKEFNVIEY